MGDGRKSAVRENMYIHEYRASLRVTPNECLINHKLQLQWSVCQVLLRYYSPLTHSDDNTQINHQSALSIFNHRHYRQAPDSGLTSWPSKYFCGLRHSPTMWWLLTVLFAYWTGQFYLALDHVFFFLRQYDWTVEEWHFSQSLTQRLPKDRWRDVHVCFSFSSSLEQNTSIRRYI